MTAMAEGTIAITVDAPTFSYVTENPEKSKTVGQWHYGINPAGPVKRVMTPFSFYITINGASKRKEAAWLFLQFVVSKPVQVAVGGPIVAMGRKSVVADPAFEKGNPWLPEWKNALIENSKYADPHARPVIPEWPEVGDIMGAELESVIAGVKSVEDAVKDANEKIRQVMEEAGYYK
jgi:ABC-type glycerol-3-phosphate transport system substrate-binding protein